MDAGHVRIWVRHMPGVGKNRGLLDRKGWMLRRLRCWSLMCRFHPAWAHDFPSQDRSNLKGCPRNRPQTLRRWFPLSNLNVITKWAQLSG